MPYCHFERPKGVEKSVKPKKKNNNKMNKITKLLTLALLAFAALSCDKVILTEPKEELLEVNANNLSGKWQLFEWDGNVLAEGTYVYLDIVRNGQTYTMYQNMDSFSNVPHVITGKYTLTTDPELGTIIRGSYDHDNGEWTDRYIVRTLTSDTMIWVPTDNQSSYQVFLRVKDIPVVE